MNSVMRYIFHMEFHLEMRIEKLKEAILFCYILTWLISSSLNFVPRYLSEYILLRKYLFLVNIFNNPMVSKDVYIILSANLFLNGFWQICLGPLVFAPKEVEN